MARSASSSNPTDQQEEPGPPRPSLDVWREVVDALGEAVVAPGLADRLVAVLAEAATVDDALLQVLQSLERTARAEAEQNQERLRFLAQASAILAESLDLDVTLARVASLAVPTLGDWCVIHLVDGEAVTVAAAAHAEPALVGKLREVHDRYPVDLSAREGVGATIRTGRTAHHPSVTDGVLRDIARDPRHLNLLRHLGFGAVVTIPLTGRGRRLGALSIASNQMDGLTPADIATAEDLARRAAVAIDNARLHNELRLQAALLRTQSEAGLEGQLIVSPDGEMLSFNHRFADMWGFADEVMLRGIDDEALARGAEQVVDPVAFLAGVRDAYDHPRASRDEIQFTDGRVFDRVGAPLYADDVYLGYAWYFRDISDQKRAALELFKAGERFATLARTLQQSLLPPQLPAVAGVELAARYHPAGAGADVGGDFYDVFRLGRDRWGVMVGDVCGKGPDAAAITAFARYTIRAAAMQTRSPARALAVLNDAMLRHAADGGPNRFATAVYARLRPRRGAVDVNVASGGHPLPLVRRAGGTVETVGRPGTLLGVLPTLAITDAAITLHPGDAMILVTDGVAEARLDGDEFGDDRLRALLETTDGKTPTEIAAIVEEAVLDHQHGVAADDIAVLVIGLADDPGPV